MKLSLHAVGRMKNGPERELFARYFDRASASGKQPLCHFPVLRAVNVHRAPFGQFDKSRLRAKKRSSVHPSIACAPVKLASIVEYRR